MGGRQAKAGAAAQPAVMRPIHAIERFDDFYLREYPATVTLAWALSGSRHIAEDLAQEAFMAAWRQWPRIAEARAVVRMAAGRPADVPEPSAATAEVWRAVRALPRRQAQVLALHYLLGCSVSEIATILDRSERTVKLHLHNGRAGVGRRLGLQPEDLQ